MKNLRIQILSYFALGQLGQLLNAFPFFLIEFFISQIIPQREGTMLTTGRKNLSRKKLH